MINNSIKATKKKIKNYKYIKKNEYIPAVVYGNKKNTMIFIKIKEFIKIYINQKKISKIIILEINKQYYHVIIKKVQVNPILNYPIHIDFLAISKKMIKISINIKIININNLDYIKNRKVINMIKRNILIKCYPINIPEYITVDIKKFNNRKKILIKDIKVSEKIKIIENQEQVILIIKKQHEEKTK